MTLILGGAAGLSVNSTALVTGVLTTTAATVHTGGITMPDNAKAIFGAGSDLQIYHNTTGFTGNIIESATGNLYIRSNSLYFQKADGTENNMFAISDGAVSLAYDNNVKLATTATGIGITGAFTATTTGTVPTIYGGSGAGGFTFTLQSTSGNANHSKILVGNVVGADNGGISLYSAGTSVSTPRMRIFGTNGDIYFYAADGTTPSFVYDESAGLIINEAGADRDFRVESDTNANALIVDGATGNIGFSLASTPYGSATTEGLFYTAGAGFDIASNTNTLRVNRNSTGGNDRVNIELQNNGTTRAEFGSLGAENGFYLSDSTKAIISGYSDEVVINETGADMDFRVESDTIAAALTVDGGTGNVGVGSAGLTSTGPIATSSVGAAVTSFKSVCTVGDQTATSLILQSGRTDVYYHMQAFVSGTTEVFRIEANGDVKNTNNSYGALSDAKLKENIVDASPKLADLMLVKVRNYNLIGETTKQIGVVAQELEAVFPSMVDENADRDKDGNLLETTTKGVKYSVFVPMLIKAIQEQQATITALTARITALENA
jgi:hypothetical protein